MKPSSNAAMPEAALSRYDSKESGARAGGPGGEQTQRSVHYGGLLERYSGIGLLLLLILLYTVTLPGQFLSQANLIGVSSNQATTAILALGLLLPLACGVFDLSIGATMTLAMVVATVLFQSTDGAMPVAVAMLIALAAGVLVGVVNGILVVGARINAFIATLGVGSVLTGISQLLADGTTVSFGIPDGFISIGRSTLFGVPTPVYAALVLALVLWYVLGHTPFGRQVYATGAGREASRLSGVPTDRRMFVCLVISSVCATLAGILLAARLGSAPPGVGATYLLPAYAAAFLGSTMIRPGRFNVPGLLLAIAILSIGINGLQLHGVPFWVEATFQGVALLVAVLFARERATNA